MLRQIQQYNQANYKRIKPKSQQQNGTLNT